VNSLVFDQMASLVTVRSLLTPLGLEVRAEWAANDACSELMVAGGEEGYDPNERISLVLDGEEPIGWVGLDMVMVDGDGTVRSCAEPIQPGSMLSADTSGLEAAELFGASTRHFYFVLDQTRITGTLHYQDLFRLPFRLCMFALVLHLEDSALRLVKVSPKESWEALPEGRREKAEIVYETRRSRAHEPTHLPFADLLESTTFCDKGTIIRKLGLLPDVDEKTLKRIFRRAEEVRNTCAHTGLEGSLASVPIERTDLAQFIREIKELIERIEAVCAN